MDSYLARSSCQSATIFSGGTPSCRSCTVKALSRSVVVLPNSPLAENMLLRPEEIPTPMRMDQTGDFSPTLIPTPPHRWPAYKPDTGIKSCETNFNPGRCLVFNAAATSSPFI